MASMGFLRFWGWVTTFYRGLYSGSRPGYIFSVFTRSLSGRRNSSDILWRSCSIYITASWTDWLILDKEFLSWIFQHNHHDLSLLKIILSFTEKFFIYFRKGEVIFPFDMSLAFRGRDSISRLSEEMFRVLSPSACIHSLISIPGLQKQGGKMLMFSEMSARILEIQITHITLFSPCLSLVSFHQ